MAEAILQKALQGKTNFEAFALINIQTSVFSFLAAGPKAESGLLPALEGFALRAVENTESPDQITALEQVVYYDISQRQVVCNTVKGKDTSYLFIAVVQPRKAYKRATQQLIRQLETALN